MHHFRHPPLPHAALRSHGLLPAGLLLLGMTAGLTVEALQPRVGLAIYAVVLPGQPLRGPDALAEDPLAADWRIRRVVAAWPLTIMLLDRLPGAPGSGVAGLHAMLGPSLLVSLPADSACAGLSE